MNRKINFDTANSPFIRIIGNGIRYEVPPYQRDYSWEEEQWNDLWEDLMVLYNAEKTDREEHYMGYLVLQKQDTNLFTIIDGQQRITTITILILAILQLLKNSDSEDDKERLAIYEDDYIRKKQGSSLSYKHKLKLNRNNDEYYRNDLANLSNNPAKRNLKRSEHLMRRSKEFFEKKLKETKMSGSKLGEFIEMFSNLLIFTVITVGDDTNAYKIFETLNARGVQLSTPDLLKNYLFSMIDPHFENPHLINEKEEQWSKILGNLKKNEFSKFLRTYWNSKNTLVAKNQLFKKIKNTITTPQKADGLLVDLRQKSEVYTDLQDFQSDRWQAYKPAVKECLYVLKTFGIVQPYAMLLSSAQHHTKEGFEKLCKHLLAFVVRYHAVCHKPAHEIERTYNQMAMAIDKGEHVNAIKEKLQKFYPKDKEFKNAFEYFAVSTRVTGKKANYFLSQIENNLNPSNPIPLQNDYTVEHILPQKGAKNDDYWQQAFEETDLAQFIQRLGNLTLLTQRDNQKVNCDNFNQKKEIFKNSSLKIVAKITAYNDWNAHNLTVYQQFLAAKACEVWNINF